MKILYLEDNKYDIDLTLKHLLKKLPGSEIDVVPSLAEARNKIFPQNNYVLLLLDMNLPDGNGFDLLVEIRQKNLSVPVIVLTGSGDEESAVVALKAGADDYVVKRHGYLETLNKTIEIALFEGQSVYNRKKQILNVIYVEPNQADIDFTKKHLKRYAPYIKLSVCYNADELFGLLQDQGDDKEHYDILLTDYRLPGISGLEIVKTIRQIKRIPLAIVMVTGQGDEEIAIQALRLGVDEYLVKRPNYLFRLPSTLMSAYQRHELEKKQAALQNSEERFRRLAENARDIIFQFELLPVNRFSYVSPAATIITGYTPEEFYADHDLIWKMTQHNDRHLIRNLAGTLDRSLTLRWTRKDGETIWIELRNVAIFNERNEIIAIEGIARDITEGKRATDKLIQERILLKTLIDNLPDNIYVKDIKMRKVLANKTDLEVIGKSEEEVIGKDDTAFFSPEVAAPLIADDRKVLEKGESVIDREELVENIKGEKIWLLTSKLPLYDHEGNITGIIGIGHNITERKKAEELLKEREQKLKEKNEEYQRLNKEYLAVNEELTESLKRVQKMNDDLRIAKEKAEESDKLKTAFLANMSHEIRTPMNGIFGFTQILRQTSLDHEKQEYYLDIINKSCDRLLSVVNDIIDISKIESGIIDLQYEYANIDDLLQELYNFYYESSRTKNLIFKIQKKYTNEAVFCNTDIVKLKQIISILIDNAIKFTESGSITVSFGKRDDIIEFVVEDSGIGIDEKDQKIIFERFRQADENYTRKFGGTGLGLSIAKAFIDKLGGKIWYQSTRNKGTTFFVHIPYRPFNEQESTGECAKEACDYNWKDRKILIAEDETSNYEYLAEALEGTKITIFRAINGVEAINIYEKIKPDVILMDLKMPKMDGYQASKKIRESDKEIPIIALTAYALETDKTKILKAGFNEYISKPVYIDTLMSVLDPYLKHDD